VKISCSSQSLDRKIAAGTMDLPGFIRYAAETLRIPCVEFEDKHLEGTSPAYLRGIRTEVERRGLTVANLAFFCSFGYPTEGENDAELERAVLWMEVARALGSPCFRIFAGWMGGPNPGFGLAGPAAAKPEPAWNEMIRCVRAACEQARAFGLHVVIENHDHGGFLSSSSDVLRLFAEAGSDNLSLLLDTGNYVDGLDGIARTAHLAKRHVHLKARDIRADGRDATFDLDATLDALSNAGFDGSLSVEYEGTQDELDCLPRIVSYLKSR
jgi:sugar phosphate isomerase/epimerase